MTVITAKELKQSIEGLDDKQRLRFVAVNAPPWLTRIDIELLPEEEADEEDDQEEEDEEETEKEEEDEEKEEGKRRGERRGRRSRRRSRSRREVAWITS